MVIYVKDGFIVNGVNVYKCDYVDNTGDPEPTCENINIKGDYCYQSPMCAYKRKHRHKNQSCGRFKNGKYTAI